MWSRSAVRLVNDGPVTLLVESLPDSTGRRSGLERQAAAILAVARTLICGPGGRTWRWASQPTFFSPKRGEVSDIQTEIETRLRSAEPDVEVLLAEQVATERVRVVVDHPDGVDLDLCERVTAHLRDLLVEYSLEVSSPGPERPLTKPEHFRRFLGRRARVRTRDRLEGRNSFTGELVGANDDAVTVAADVGGVSVPYDDVKRSNLLDGRD